jgi:hypothetical protein
MKNIALDQKAQNSNFLISWSTLTLAQEQYHATKWAGLLLVLGTWPTTAERLV